MNPEIKEAGIKWANTISKKIPSLEFCVLPFNDTFIVHTSDQIEKFPELKDKVVYRIKSSENIFYF